MSKHTQQQGFSLMELMLVVAVIGILAGIAYPNYSEYVKRGNRSEGQAFLNDVSARQERYFSQNNAYITKDADLDKLALKNGNKSETGKYELVLSKVDNDGGYTLTANQQFKDTKCGNLSLNARGVRGSSGSGMSTADCWR